VHNNLLSVSKLFIRLGVAAFGGPAAHIAMMRHEVVKKRQWMDDAKFIGLVGATSLIPGPNSTELAIHIGKERAGRKGLLAAGFLFIGPAVLITGAIAWLYSKYSTLPSVQPFIYGIKPAVISIILLAVYPLARASVKNFILGLLGFFALILALAGFPEIAVMFGLGVCYALYRSLGNASLPGILPIPLAAGISNTDLFLVFLKIGSVLYGSGYALFAFIDEELVTTGVLSRQVLTDAIAVGQFTPGPVFSSVTFIGYQVNGFWGALVSTVGVFLPSFVFVGLLGTLLPFLKKYIFFSHFLSAVNVISVAIIAAVCWQLGRESISDWKTAFIAMTSFVLLLVFPKINSAIVVLVGALVGYLLTLIG
jgi:chromate transporter